MREADAMMNRNRLVVWTVCLLLVGFLLNGAAAEKKKTPVAPTKIDLNKATVEQIGKCPGLNSTLAKSIVEYREKSGPFKAPEDLLKVKGITKELFNKIKPQMEKNMLYIMPSAPSSSDDEEEPSLAPSKC
jgi:competence ComEA-like helix-hairpin-helix protein